MFQKLRAVIKTVRLSELDLSTEDGRSNDRNRRILLTSIVSVMAKASSMAAMLITVPMTLNYLGVERFGLWMSISSLLALMAFADMGLGNGLMNAVSESHGKRDNDGMKACISSAICILSLIAVIIIFFFYLVNPYIDWGWVFNIHSQKTVSELAQALGGVVICFALGIPSAIVQRVQMGLQMGFVSSLWQIVSAILTVIAILMVINFEKGLSWLVFSSAGVPVLVLMINSFWFFGVTRPDLKLSWSKISRKDSERLIRIGLLFFTLQITASIGFESDFIIIGHFLGQEYVAQYAIILKLFSIVLIGVTIISAPYWPAFSEANARGDFSWIRYSLRKSIIRSLVILIAGCSLLLLFGKSLMIIWLGNDLQYSVVLFVWFAIWIICKGIGAPLSMFFNGLGIVRSQVIIGVIFAIISIALKIVLVTSFGMVGILMALTITYLTVAILPYYLMTTKTLRVMKQEGSI